MASSFFLFFFFSPPPFLRRSFHCLLLLKEKLMQHIIRSGSSSHIIWSTPRNHEQPWQYHPPSALSRNCEYSFKPFFFNLDLSDRWNQSRRANEYCFILGQNAAYQVDLDLPAHYLNYWKKNFVFCKHTELKLQTTVCRILTVLSEEDITSIGYNTFNRR